MSNQSSVSLSSDELDAALSYLETGGDSFFLPQPFELKAIRHSWDKIKPKLENVNLLSYQPRECVTMMAPKDRKLVRPVHLLDPIDSILYTGLVFQIAPTVQVARDRVQKGKVFSYHFSSEKMGTRETFKSDWKAKKSKIEDLCMKYSYVGVTDIVDFFPRVYLHRLENAVCDTTGNSLQSKAINNFLTAWSGGTSYGLPVGPRASNYLAEILLIEVDEYLTSCGIEFVRYVDDYCLFGLSKDEVLSCFFQLGERLHQTQGLSLNSAKTQFYKADKYLENVLHQEDPLNWAQDVIELLSESENPYTKIDSKKLTEEQKKKINAIDARKVLEKALKNDPVDYRSIKFILTFLSAFRQPDLVNIVLDNLSELMPLSNTVANFFDSFDDMEADRCREIGKTITKYMSSGNFVPEYQVAWLLEPFGRSSSWNSLDSLRNMARNNRSQYIRRQAILALKKSKNRSAVLDAKTALGGSRDWEKRAILFACQELPKDERDAVVSQMGGAGGDWTVNNLLDKAVLKYIKDDVQ